MIDQYRDILFSLYKQFYDEGIYQKSNLDYFVQIGTLSKDGYQQIVGEPYETSN